MVSDFAGGIQQNAALGFDIVWSSNYLNGLLIYATFTQLHK